jgi:hypothetical protein
VAPGKGMNLLLRAIIESIEDIARKKGIQDFRVDYKRNARGELVIALIVSDQEGPLGPHNIPG